MRVLKSEVARIVKKSKENPYRVFLEFYKGGAALAKASYENKITTWNKMIELCQDDFMDLNAEQLHWLAEQDYESPVLAEHKE